MLQTKERFIVDEKGEKMAVVFPIEEYMKLQVYLLDMEDALDIRKAKERSEGYTRLEDFKRELKTEGVACV